ncbi:nucleotidyltransferase [Natrialba hulunbeirensis JCM 10989]|uniref:Nucleotidyltransferase n=1 Tax=Natrialba hulunbeirensis JCM 10989 TaxID=1227493 RepID=M0AD26_9EURY|nr:nucleotidyltransferase domain-containing protein [Natrialba hulunbeirensis]ELY95767.1 nucleotidyltransferase [Natrialba hulunbeirensis JCM 10989]
MKTHPNSTSTDRTRIEVDIPPQSGGLFRSEATDEILLFLSRHHDESFSITDIAETVDYTRPTITKTVDILSDNDLVVEERDGTRRLVQINRDRLTQPDEPYLTIPQSEFHAPVKAAMEELLDELDDVLAVVLYGSVARGEADRRSDIDLWVLVRENRMGNQRRANRVRQSLESDSFDANRYAFEIDVEGLQAIPNYANELREVLRDGIAVHRTDEFITVRNMILHGDGDE